MSDLLSTYPHNVLSVVVIFDGHPLEWLFCFSVAVQSPFHDLLPSKTAKSQISCSQLLIFASSSPLSFSSICCFPVTVAQEGGLSIPINPTHQFAVGIIPAKPLFSLSFPPVSRFSSTFPHEPSPIELFPSLDVFAGRRDLSSGV